MLYPFLTALFTLVVFFSTLSSIPLIIMLDPAGDAQNAGRHIDDSFERGLTLQCVEHIKECLEAQFPEIHFVLTRFPGESVQPLQNANFANRLAVDLYVSIHLYHEVGTKPELFIYTYTHDKVITKNKESQFSFCPLDQAHRGTSAVTNSIAAAMHEHFLNHAQTMFTARGVFNVPFKPLMGIKAPALALEVGLKQKDDWRLYVDAFADAIANIIKQKLI